MLNHPDIHHTKYVEELKNFAIGGTAGIVATVAILPIDYIKVHIQCLSEGKSNVKISALSFAKEIYHQKGLLEFYSGLSSAITRQAVYATTRLGLYKTLVDRHKERQGTDSISFWFKFLYSSIM